MPIVQETRCANHPERPGAALCMSCRKAVCQECATRWDGINYCIACLRQRRVAATERSSVVAWLAWLGATGGLFFAAAWSLTWAGSLLAQLR